MYESKGDYARAEAYAAAACNVLLMAAERTVPGLSGGQARNWISKHAPRADVLLSVLRSSGKLTSPEAYPAIWRTKQLVSRLQVGRDAPKGSSPEMRELFSKLRNARARLAGLVAATPRAEQADAYRDALTAANAQKEELEKQLAELNPGSQRELAIRDATIEALLGQLPEGVAVIDFVKLDDWDYVDRPIETKRETGHDEERTAKDAKAVPVYDAFVLRSDRRPDEATPAFCIPLGPAEPIESALSDWRVDIAQEQRHEQSRSTTLRNPAKILRTLIWEKLEAQLEGIHTVVVIPDGELHRLPWAALPGRRDDEYLLHDYAVLTAASGQQLYGVLLDPPITAPSELLVVGGIDYGQGLGETSPLRNNESVFWPQLPGAEAEVTSVVKLWGSRGTVKQLGRREADERALARWLPRVRFAHLATHGFFDTSGEVYGTNLRDQPVFNSAIAGSKRRSSVAFRNPLLMTGIVTAGANRPSEKDDLGLPIGDDGILTAEEISGLDMRNTELVTLSACETGLGDVAAGEGVYGLTRVLHQSGVRSVVA
ncbi:MAG: CHAT domain-containing protein, partial [Planctomycetota bacterium]